MASSVWFVGKGKRVITAQNWLDQGIVAEETVWEAANGWSVPTALLTNDQLNVLSTMRDQFQLDEDGPRAWPAPNNEIRDYNDSAYIYYARIKQFYEELINTETGPRGERGTQWYQGTGAPGTIVGSLPGDKYLNTANGDVYTLS